MLSTDNDRHRISIAVKGKKRSGASKKERKTAPNILGWSRTIACPLAIDFTDRLLYQLSYVPVVVGTVGFEPTTSRVDRSIY